MKINGPLTSVIAGGNCTLKIMNFTMRFVINLKFIENLQIFELQLNPVITEVKGLIDFICYKRIFVIANTTQ